MQLSFTTLACPTWDVDQVIAAARRYGYDAFDFRHCRGTTDLLSLPEFTTGLDATAKRIAASGLRVSGLSSSIQVFASDPGQREQAVNAVAAYARLAARLGAPVLRVFGGSIRTTPRDEAVRIAGITLRAMAAVAIREGVVVAVETHDDWCRGADVKAMLEAAQCGPAAGVIWDVLNSWEASGETPAETWSHVHGLVVGTHWKDAATCAGEPQRYVLPGEGCLPLREFLQVLVRGGYTGCHTLEWEKAWHPELADADVALPAFVACMRKLAAAEPPVL